MSRSPFSSTYAEARARFREGAAQLGWTCTAHPIAGYEPDGGDLTIDVADSGGAPECALVVSSGLHGVEGYFGSAVQIAFLEDCRERPPEVPCVLLHALNPYGFAWCRRWNEDEVDLNRNFIRPEETYRGSPPRYAALDPLLNPPHAPRRWDFFTPRLLWSALRHGANSVQQSIATGQYDFPGGLFYGGSEPAATVCTLEQLLPRLLAGSQRVVHFDFHTGLGRFGTHRLLLDVPLTDSQRAGLTETFGADRFDECEARTIAYEARGGFGPWCVAQGWAADYLFACAEFGTYGPLRLLAGLRAENQATRHCSPDSVELHRARQRLLELFCPADPQWRERTVSDGVDLIRGACRMLWSKRV